jgi:hypothetical protein
MMGPNDWTIEFWLYSTYWYSGCAPVAVGYHTTISAAYNSIMFPYGGNGNLVYGGLNNGGWNKFNGSSVFPNIINNAWYHYAVVTTDGGSTTKFFRNGVLSNTLSGTTAGYQNLASAGPTTIGTYAGNPNSTMLLQDIRFSSCARYTANFTPPTRFI